MAEKRALQHCKFLTISEKLRAITEKSSFPRESISVSSTSMVRIREILDPELRQRVIQALADRRGVSVAAIPDWFELDDLDYVDLLNDLKEESSFDQEDDSRM